MKKLFIFIPCLIFSMEHLYVVEMPGIGTEEVLTLLERNESDSVGGRGVKEALQQFSDRMRERSEVPDYLAAAKIALTPFLCLNNYDYVSDFLDNVMPGAERLQPNYPFSDFEGAGLALLMKAQRIAEDKNCLQNQTVPMLQLLETYSHYKKRHIHVIAETDEDRIKCGALVCALATTGGMWCCVKESLGLAACVATILGVQHCSHEGRGGFFSPMRADYEEILYEDETTNIREQIRKKSPSFFSNLINYSSQNQEAQELLALLKAKCIIS